MSGEFIPSGVRSVPVIPAKAGIQIPGLSGRSRTMTIGWTRLLSTGLPRRPFGTDRNDRFCCLNRYITSFTLLETILAMSIIIMVLGTVYSFYSFSLRMTESAKLKLEKAQLARVILGRMESEFRSITSSGTKFSSVLYGDPNRISFITTVVPSRAIFIPREITDKARVTEHDLRLVEYYLSHNTDDNNTLLGFQRDELSCLLTPYYKLEKTEDNATDNTTFEENQEQREEDKEKIEEQQAEDNESADNTTVTQPLLKQMLITDKVKYLRFDYYDGKRWLSKWHPDSPDALPRAVKATIGFTEMSEDDYKQETLIAYNQRPYVEDRYSLIVSLILSDDLKAEFEGSKVEEDETQ